MASLHYLKVGPGSGLVYDNGTFVYKIFHQLLCLLLLAYVLSRRGSSFRQLGLRWSFRRFSAGLHPGRRLSDHHRARGLVRYESISRLDWTNGPLAVRPRLF